MKSLLGGPSSGGFEFEEAEDSGDESGVEAIFVGFPEPENNEDEILNPRSQDEDSSQEDDDDSEEFSSNLAEAGSVVSEDNENASETSPASVVGRNLRISVRRHNQVLVHNHDATDENNVTVAAGTLNISWLRSQSVIDPVFHNLRDDVPLQILTEEQAAAEIDEELLNETIQPNTNDNRTLNDEDGKAETVEITTTTTSSCPDLIIPDSVAGTLLVPTEENGQKCNFDTSSDENLLQLPDYQSQPLSEHSPDQESGKRKYDELEAVDSNSDEEFIESKTSKPLIKTSLLSSPFLGPYSYRNQESPSLSDNSPFYSNPMESELDGENDDTFRGDRIGNTSYSERNVIKILMKWMKELEPVERANEKEAVTAILTLDTVLDEELSLLWDLSSENDIIDYLVGKNVFTLIKDTLMGSNCCRLKEIALGIFANLLSSRNVLNNFVEIDEQLDLIKLVVAEIQMSSDVAGLVQAFSVLERVCWFINEVKPIISWIILILNLEFASAMNFLLESSTNVLLLGKIIVTILPLFEILGRTNVFEEGETEDTDESVLETMMTRNYDVFCETAFVPSLCEGLQELLKCSFDDDADLEDDVQLPPCHVQTALCSGLGCLCYLQKFISGQNILKKEGQTILNFLTDFFGKFHLYTEKIDVDKTFEYYASGLNLMSFCHRGFPNLDSTALLKSVQAACRLVKRDELKEREGIEIDLLNSIGIAVHEHLAELGDTFGLDTVYACVKQDKTLIPFLKFVDKAANNFDKDNGTCGGHCFSNGYGKS